MQLLKEKYLFETTSTELKQLLGIDPKHDIVLIAKVGKGLWQVQAERINAMETPSFEE
jgi:hypothetical protein